MNVLGVVYLHTKTEDGGDLYFTRFAEPHQDHLDINNWYEESWFTQNRVRLLGTSSVYRVPTKPVNGSSLDLVVKNCRVGEDVPINTHTLEEFMSAEFNSPWEEFALVMEMADKQMGQRFSWIRAQRPLAIYVPPQRMQLWQSGRSRSKINRIRARHPGVDLDILKQYKLVYEWIRGKNLTEIFERIKLELPDVVHHLQAMQKKAFDDLSKKGYHMADMKPEHVIIHEDDCERIEHMGHGSGPDAAGKQVDAIYRLMEAGNYSVIDYELLFRTPEHEDRVKATRRHSYLDDMRNRLEPTPLPPHLSRTEIFGVPYIFGHAESTGGRMWVVGRNARLFDYFLPERWRKTPSLSLSGTNEVFYTVTKDNIHLVWKTSRVGEFPTDAKYSPEEIEKIRQFGINSPFEEFSLSQALNEKGIHAAYVRAIYMTGSLKVEISSDARKYQSHQELVDNDGNPVLDVLHNYITIRGYYNGPDKWVSEHEEAVLLTPVDLQRAVRKNIITGADCASYLERVKERLRSAGYDGSLLKPNDLLLAVDAKGNIMKDRDGQPDVIICNFEIVWKV
ncbi:MAG: hypothetical protein A2010_17170 [Nitrospirae bacterium GWD2_57_9]|nr:MAG: hypothetical protein A2010_17170 [Nitrospirae bacterium GWD2_57_9]OGW46773.1 MAG: hypothetical protein A2078_08070 [Nitrospirae bacterium GWC2_57_9]